MAKSKAQKQRAHQVRQGYRDPADSRGGDFDFSLHERKTKTLKERKNRAENKHRLTILKGYDSLC